MADKKLKFASGCAAKSIELIIPPGLWGEMLLQSIKKTDAIAKIRILKNKKDFIYRNSNQYYTSDWYYSSLLCTHKFKKNNIFLIMEFRVFLLFHKCMSNHIKCVSNFPL